jgi:hypothetical protein
MKKQVLCVAKKANHYSFENGHVMKREWDTCTPNGVKISGRWALRDNEGKLIDFDQYSNDIAERNNLDLYNLS